MSGLVPKLRFSEFNGRWQWAHGDELFDPIDRRPAAPGLPILAITQEQGAVPRDQIDYHVSVTDASVASYKEVRPGDFIISLRSFQGGIEYSRVQGICSPAYIILGRKGDGDDDFYRHLFKCDRFIQQITRNIEGIRDGKMISYRQFSEQLLPAPSLAEQRKIAECLTSLDELIAAEGRRLEALRKWKKALMQNLFPREGETTPRLRFPEFRTAGPWQEEPLGALVRFQSGGTPSRAQQRYWNGSIPWATAKDMKPFLLKDTEDHITIDATEDGVKQVPAGTTLILTRGMTLLKDFPICIVQRPMSFNQDLKALRPLGELDELFLAYLLFSKKPLVLKMVDVAGHGTGRLDTDKLRALVLTLPNGKEQHRIASCLGSLDTLITEQANKLATLKTHKQGLMQSLFPTPEEPSPA